MVDLHLHTNASDGRCTPAELVSRAGEAGLSVMSVTDHDTFAGLDEAARHAAAAGIRLITGIEITAVWRGHDVHVLGYYLDPTNPDIVKLLEGQRIDRERRVHEMLRRLRALGAPVEFADVAVKVSGRVPHAIGRPQVARALVRAGHVTDNNQAFERYLAEGRPAFVGRSGSAPADIVGLIVAARGIAALAHPGLLDDDELIRPLAEAGMQALEVYHPDHSDQQRTHYLTLADHLNLAATGGSDYHAETDHGAPMPGTVTLPAEAFARLDALASHDT